MGGTNTEIGARSRSHWSKLHRTRQVDLCRAGPLQPWHGTTGLLCLAALVSPHIEGSHLGVFSLSSLTCVSYASSVPKHVLEQILVPLNQYHRGGICEGNPS